MPGNDEQIATEGQTLPKGQPISRRRPTLRDVAIKAGVSSTTASLILNDRPINVPPETRRRVLDAAAELHYVPNALVRSLQIGRTGTLGVYMQFRASIWQNAFVGALVDGLRSGAAETDHDVLLYQPPTSGATAGTAAAGAVAPLLDGRADAAVLWLASDDAPLDGLIRARFPAVVLMHDAVPPPLGAVHADEHQGSQLLLDHLLALGHRSIAYYAASGAVLSPHLRVRRDAFLAAASNAGIALPPRHVLTGAPVDALEEVLRQVASRTAQRSTAIVCAFEELAYRTLGVAARLGLRVPQDISLAGWEVVSAAGTATGTAMDAATGAATGSTYAYGGDDRARPAPWLTAVRLPIWKMGHAAATLAVELAQAGHAPPRATRLTFPADLQIGNSTGPAPQAS